MTKTAKGVRLRVRLIPGGDRPTRVSLGISPENNGGRRGTWDNRKKTFLEDETIHGPTERTFLLTYGKGFQRGDRVQIISRWESDHYWGKEIFTLP